MRSYTNPLPTVDAVIFYKDWDHVLIIKRKNPPLGHALPGGFVNEGESLEEAVRREVKEELGIDIFVLEQFRTYSNPDRDPRRHVMSTVFLATATSEPVAGDDAASVNMYDLTRLPVDFAFDHKSILLDVQLYIRFGIRPKP